MTDDFVVGESSGDSLPKKGKNDEEKVNHNENSDPTPLGLGSNPFPKDPQEVFRLLVKQSLFQGPYPPPEMMKIYEEIIPGISNRIFENGFAQTNHRMELERKNIDHNIINSRNGQIFAFILGLTGLALGAACILFGHDWAGATIGGATLVGLVSVFITGKNSQKIELKSKKPKSPLESTLPSNKMSNS